mmetsp:Transcript_9760/g.36367  ORF Transcript_9760/g.36367 Transcript_9760/m.36367 type:complete len:81 (+) Transcript_9760:732-974(+)
MQKTIQCACRSLEMDKRKVMPSSSLEWQITGLSKIHNLMKKGTKRGFCVLQWLRNPNFYSLRLVVCLAERQTGVKISQQV